MLEGNVEFQMISAARGRGGWVGDRPQLPPHVEEAAIKIMAISSTTERQHELRLYLRQVFATMVEAEQCRQTYRSTRPDEGSSKIHLGSGRVQKFPNVAAAALRKLQGEYCHLGRLRRVSHARMTQFLRRIRSNPGAFGLLDMTARSHGYRQLELCFVPHRRRDIFNDLAAAFDGAFEVLKSARKPGPSDPVSEQLARALAELYFHFVGKRPRRGYDAYDRKDSGRFLKLCQIMASAVNDAQPALPQRPAAQMAKVARRMMDELKAELEAA